MDLAQMFGALRRRWWVVLVVLALTAGLAAGTVGAFPPTYTVEGEYLLERAAGPTDAQLTSPAVLAAIVESRGFGDDPPPPFDQMPYEVVLVEGSVLSLRVEWSDPGPAREGLDQLLATLDMTVREITTFADDDSAVELLGRGVQAGSSPLDEEQAAAFPSGFAAEATVLVREAPGVAAQFDASDYTAGVLAAVVNAPRNVRTYLERDFIEGYEVSFDARGPAPLLTLSVSGTDRDAVLRAYADAEEQLSEELAALQSRQDELGANATVAQALARPDGPTLVESNLRRPLAVILLLGLLVAAGAALSVDSFLTRRADESDGQSSAHEGPAAAPEAGGDGPDWDKFYAQVATGAKRDDGHGDS